MAYDFAEQLGISIPKSVYISIDETSYSDAIQLLHERGPVIAKPTDSSLSNGVTLGIRTEGELTTALAFARKHSENVVVQQQVSGDEVRFPVVNGKVVAAILRQTPQIVGDGASTIQKLIHKENELRKNLPETIVPYPLLDEVLVPADLLTSQRIPAVGEVVELNRNTMIMGGASIYNVMNNIHPTYLALVEKLTRPLGKGFVVADVIIKDYTEPAEDNNYWFLEFNLTPAIKLFYSCRDGKHFRVAEDYLAPMIVKAIQ
jgi:cyanophycin synthetase